MAEEEMVIAFQNDFYRDRFRTLLVALGIILTATTLLIAASSYLFLSKPHPVNFLTDDQWRIVPPVPLDQPYLTTPNLIQWVSNILPLLFSYDFINYSTQAASNRVYFTPEGQKKFLEILNQYAPSTSFEKSKTFIRAAMSEAPFIINEGLLNGRYSWWVQVVLGLNYSDTQKQSVNLKVLVTRMPTLDNLYGVIIDNIILSDENKAARVAVDE